MPVIPFSSAARVTEIDRATQEQRDAEEARRYREKSDAKLKELMDTPVKRFDPQGGTSPIDMPEPVAGGWRVRTNGDPQPNGDALPGGVFNRMVEPAIDDPMRDETGFGQAGEWTDALARPAAPEGEGFVGMGSGGPEQPATGLSEAEIADLKQWRASRDQDQSDLKMRQAIGAADKSPDEVARSIELAERTGANRLEVQEDPKGFEQVDIMSRVQGLRQSAPKLRSWLDDPVNLEVAHDDVENLGWWEQTQAFFSPGNLSLDKVGQALQSGFVDKIPEQLYGLDQMLGDANASIYKALPDWFPGKFGLVNEQVQRSFMADMKRQEMAAQGKANAPVGETWLERGIYGAAQSAPSTITSVIITAITKSPVVGGGSMGATTAGGAYGEARDEGKSLGDAFRYALTQGGIETATEFIPLKFLVDDLAKDSSFAKTFFRQAAAEGITEQAATFLQDASTFIEMNPDKTLGEFLAERPNAALETLVASTIMSGVTTTVAQGMQAAGDQIDRNARQKRTEQLSKTFDAMAQNSKDSKLLKRLPEKYRELVNQVTKDGPLESVRIAPEAITSLAQEKGVSVEQIAQAFRIDPNEMVTAIDTGEDVVIPAGNYAAGLSTSMKEIGVSGETMHQAFAADMRLRADDFTARESEAAKAAFEAEATAREDRRETDQAFADSGDRVRNTIREQVTATGIFNADAANTQAELVGSMVETLALRTGVDPEALWKEQGFDIVAALSGEQPEADSLPQSMARTANPPGDVELEFASKELSPQEFEAWKGARDGLSNEAIAERMNAVEPDAVVSADDVKRWLFRSRERGYDSQKPHFNDRGMSPVTQRLIELRARGVKNPQIAAALYPDVDTETALNRVKALASKNKARIEERKAAISGKALAQGEKQEVRGDFTPRADRNVVRLFESANLSTLAHEGSHWYLDTLWRMSKTESPHPFVLEQLAAVLEWHGKSPNWDAMFNADGSFTKEGVDLQEAFAETFEAYLMEGKAPTTALRSVFASFKQWLLSIYKGLVSRIGGRTNLNDEIRQVFDRMLATDEAINAVHSGLARDGETMAQAILKAQDPKGLWKPERKEKFLERMRERYAAARERAEAALMARLMDEYQRTQKSAWTDEEREVRREVQSEIDERPEQRAFYWLSTGQYRDTREAQAEAAFTEAEAMRSLAQAPELGYFEANATDASIQALQARMVENGIIPIVLLFRTTSGRVIAFPGDSGNFGMHHDMAREVFGLGDLQMQHGVWNPRRWPTIEAMNAADTAWYDTTGTAADTIAPAPAQPRVMRGEKELAQTTGEGLLVYRGSGDTELGAGRLGTGLYLAEDPEIGAEWGGEAGTVDAYRITGKLFDLTEETAQGLENYAQRENTPAAEALFARLKAEGYVGIRDPWSGHINVFDAKDMVRTPQNDTELGKTWTNYALDLEEEGAGSLAQTVRPRSLGPIGKVSSLTSAMKLAGGRTFPTNRDFKVALQERVLAAAEGRMDLSEASGKMSPEVEDYLVNMVLADAAEAMKTNSNAVGWYDEKVTKALRLLSLLHPEIETDPKAKFAFVWALAVTSNGMKVNENFQLAERAYQAFKKTGKMPSDIGTGTAAKAINNSLALYNSLLETHGFEALERFMTTKTTVKAAQTFSGLPISGENLTTEVFGAAILGPKIGNGFFMNLYGSFEQLTIDRWLMRTWGRWSGSLIEDNPVQVKAKRQQLKALIQELSAEEKRAFEDIIGRKLTVGDLDAVGLAITKASQKPEKRRQMALVGLAKTKARQAVRDQILGAASAGQVRGAFGDEMRKAGNALTKYLDGQNEQPGGPPERGNIRKVFARALEELRTENPSLTMADLQALLWYPEKLVYDAAKSDDRAVTSYEDDEAPDYANAAEALVRNSGVSDRDIRTTLSRIDRELQAARRAAAARSGDRGRGTGGARSLAQSQTHDPKGERELDALGFYSAVFEAAKSVRSDVWSMGWDHARNSIVKGGAKINGQRVAPRESEMAFLGLDAMFYGTKLKGAELAEAVLDHIQAKRLLLVENFARVDPNGKAPTKAVMLDELSDYALSNVLDVRTIPFGDNKGRVITALLSRGGEFHTGLFIQALDGEVSDDPVKRYDMPVRRYQLYRGPDLAGKRELLATGLGADLRAKAARILVNENRARVLRNVTKEELEYHWEDERNESGGLVRGPGDIRLPGEDVPLFEAVIGLPEGVPGSDYRAPVSHVGGKARGTLVTAHGEERIDDKGQRTVFVGQVQSDMAQQYREDKTRAGDINKATVEATAYGYEVISENGQVISDAFGNPEMAEAELAYMKTSALNAPLVTTSEWTNVAVRSMLYRAAREGFQSISFPTAETSEIIQGNDSAAMHYETNVKGALEKLAKQLGGEVRRGSVDYDTDQGGEYQHYDVYGANGRKAFRYYTMGAAELAVKRGEGVEIREGSSVEPPFGPSAPAYILDITPAMRAKIMSEGFPLFQTKTGKGTTAPPADLPLMRLNLQAVREQYGEQALAEIPPEVAAFSATANDVDMYLATVRDIRKTLNETPPKSLWKFLSAPRNIGQGEGRISYRGIRDTDGELLKIIGERKAARGLIAGPTKDSKRSRSYDMQQAIEAAWEAGYFDGEELPTPAQFLDTLRADIDGQAPRYRRDDIPTVSMIANAERWEAWFDQNDINIHEKDTAALRAKLAVMLTGQGENAIGPDEAAPFFKMPNGRALLDGLKQGPLRDKLIREETRKRMIERNGDVFRDGTIMAKAEEYARNELQHRQWEIELEALAEAGGQRIATNALKQQAIENLRSKQVREVLNYNQYLTLERGWSEKAIKEKDPAKAAEYAKYRLLNSYMYSEGKKLAEQIEKTRKHLLAYESKSKLARLFSAGKEYAENMRGLLSDYQLRNESRKAENQRQARSAWIQTQMAGIDPFAAYADPTKSAQEQQIAAAEAIERSTVLARLSDGVDAQNYKSITVQELLAVRDEADLIWRLATLKDRLIKDGERRKLSLAAEDIAEEIEANQPNDKGPEPLETDTPGEKVKSSIQMYFAMHRTLQSLAHQFAGGKEGGVFWRYIVRPLNEAFGKLTTIRKQMGEDVAGLFGVYTTAEQERFYRDRRQFAGIGRSLTTQGRLAIALNWGNEKNRRRIMDAYGWDEAQVQEVLDSLEKRDWDWVQSVWDYMDTWFPEANRVHEAVHGAPMDKVEPLQVATRFGVYRGGYYPIKYDPRTSSKSGQRAMEADAKRQTGGIGTRSQPGFGKKRVEGKVTLPLRLSALDVITQHLDEVAKSIATEETLFDIGRILKQPGVEEAIISRHGRQIYNQVVNQIITAKFGMDGTSGLLAHLRNGATVVGLSWKVATASLQILGASNSIVRVGGPWVAAGYAKTAGGGVPLYTAARDAMRMSEFMRNRRQNQSPEMASLLDAMKSKWTPDFIARFIPRELRAMHNFMVRNGFTLMSNVQFASVDVPTWWGAYFKAQHTGASEEDAVAMADQAVVDAQGGGEIYQLAAMQSGAGTKYGALLRILTNFMSYMVTTYNLGVQRVRNARTIGQIMALGFDMIILAAVPVAGKMALDLITKGVGEDDEPEEWAEKYAREQIAFLFGPFAGISQFAGSARGDDSYGYKGPAGLMIFDVMNQLGSAVAEGEIIDEEGGLDKNFWRPANRALGIVLHYPASQIDASIRGAQAYFNGETDNPAAIFFGPPPAN
jgi:hypothetical protein